MPLSLYLVDQKPGGGEGDGQVDGHWGAGSKEKHECTSHVSISVVTNEQSPC